MGVVNAVGQAIWRAGDATYRAFRGDPGASVNENELRVLTVDQLAEAMREALGGGSSAGVNVTVDRALQTAAYWTTVTVLAESVAQIPFNVHRPKAGGKGVEIAGDVPLHRMLSKRGRPNGWQTSYRFRHHLVWQVANRGNYYALKNSAGGSLRELLPIHPSRVHVEQDQNFDIAYRVDMPRGGQRTFGRDRIFHVAGASDDGIKGLSPLAYLGESIGLAIGQDHHAGKLFANGARLWGVLQHPNKMSEPAAAALKQQFTDIYAGPDNAHKTAVLEEGMVFNPVSQNAEQAQLLDSRKLQRSIISGSRRVPAHMVNDLEKATFSNIENLARQFVDFTLMPWLEMIEQECDQQLLTAAERDAGLYCKFNAAGLLRGDAKTRAEFYNKALNDGWMNPNEVREKEDLNPYEGGDEFRRAMNTEPAAASEDDPATGDPPAPSARLAVLPTGKDRR